MVRHAAINCGESDLISDLDLYEPKGWDPEFVGAVNEKVKGRRRHSASASATTDVVPDNGELMYDFATDCWIKSTMGTEVSSSQVAATLPPPKKKRKRKKKKKSNRSKPKRKQVKKKK